MIGIIIIRYFTQGFICYNCRCQCYCSRTSWSIGQSVLEQDSEAHMAPDGVWLARVSVWIALSEQVAPLTSATGVYKCAREELACVATGPQWRANGEKWFPKRCSCFHSSPLAGAASFIRHAGEKLALQCVETLQWVTEQRPSWASVIRWCHSLNAGGELQVVDVRSWHSAFERTVTVYANANGLLCVCVHVCALAPVEYQTCQKAPAGAAQTKTKSTRYINAPTFTALFSGTFLGLRFVCHRNWKKLVQPVTRKPNRSMSAHPPSSYSRLRQPQMSSRPNCVFRKALMTGV